MTDTYRHKHTDTKKEATNLDDGVGGLAAHVVDGVLIAEPVRALDCVVEVETPVILLHVAKSSVDATLGCNSVGAGWEELGDASGLEPVLGEAKSGTKPSATSANNNSIKLVINDGVSRGDLLCSLCGAANMKLAHSRHACANATNTHPSSSSSSFRFGWCE